MNDTSFFVCLVFLYDIHTGARLKLFGVKVLLQLHMEVGGKIDHIENYV